MSSMHAVYCQRGLDIAGHTLAVYLAPRDEQIRILALAAGPWRDDELVPKNSISAPPGMQFADGDARARAGRLFSQEG